MGCHDLVRSAPARAQDTLPQRTAPTRGRPPPEDEPAPADTKADRRSWQSLDSGLELSQAVLDREAAMV